MVLVGLLKQLPAWDYINPKPYALNKEGAAARGVQDLGLDVLSSVFTFA